MCHYKLANVPLSLADIDTIHTSAPFIRTIQQPVNKSPIYKAYIQYRKLVDETFLDIRA